MAKLELAPSSVNFNQVRNKRQAFRSAELVFSGTGTVTITPPTFVAELAVYLEDSAGNLVNATSFGLSGGLTTRRLWIKWSPSGANPIPAGQVLRVTWVPDPSPQNFRDIPITGAIGLGALFDLRMILDRSLTMGAPSSNTKLSRMANGAKVGACLLGGDDTLEVVSFSHVLDNVALVATNQVKNVGGAISNIPVTIGAAVGDGAGTPAALAHADSGLGGASDTKAILLITDGAGTHSNQYRPNNAMFIVAIDSTIPVGQMAGDPTVPDRVLCTKSGTQNDVLEVQKAVTNVVAQATNLSIAKDPEGVFREPGQVDDIPFEISGADVSITVVALSPNPRRLRLQLFRPDGEPAELDPRENGQFDTALIASVTPEEETGRPYALPTGRWRARLAWDNIPDVPRDGIPYNLQVFVDSALTLEAFVHNGCGDPGSPMQVVAKVSHGGLPVRHAAVRAEISDPRGARTDLALNESDQPGRYVGSVYADACGTYQVHVLANGILVDATCFEREVSRSSSVRVPRCGDR